MPRKSYVPGIILAGISAGVFAGGLVLGMAATGWLFKSPVLGAVLTMILSAMLIIGFGGLSPGGLIIVGLLWAFTDILFAEVGISGWIAWLTMAAAYLTLGMTAGKSREQVIHAGAGPVPGTIAGIILFAVIFPQKVAGEVDEAVISAAMISAARSGNRYAAVLKSRDTQREPET